MDISSKILSDPINKWLFSQQKDHLYIVGGYLRDLVIGRTSKDRDFTLNGDAAKLAKQAAEKFNGTYILLKKGLTCRIVLKDKSIIDINYLTEPIEDDLEKRDFTINAIAWSPHSGILDPFNGLKDIKRKRIKVINAVNLKADPLRVFRAYRFAAQLGYNIAPGTRKLLKKYAKDLKYSAPERITDEFIKLLNDPEAGKHLNICNNDDVLTYVLHINKDDLLNRIRLIKRFDSSSDTLSPESNYLESIISQGMTRSAIIRLALLVGSKKTLTDTILKLLKLSRANTVALKRIRDAYHTAASSKINNTLLYRAFSKAGENSIETAVIIGLIKKSTIPPLIRKAKEYIEIRKNPILSGNSIQEILGIGPNRKIGLILTRLEEEQFKGNITSKNEAASWIISNLT